MIYTSQATIIVPSTLKPTVNHKLPSSTNSERMRRLVLYLALDIRLIMLVLLVAIVTGFCFIITQT